VDGYVAALAQPFEPLALGGGVGACLRCESQEAWIATQRFEGGIPLEGIPPSLSEVAREAVLQQFDGRAMLPEQRQCGSPRVGESVLSLERAYGSS
jgi:hypothetical protein